MKITTDFITNSSSTNYVVAYKSQPSIDAKILEDYPFLSNYYDLLEHVLITTESWHNTTEGEIISSVDELDRYYISYYGCGEEKVIEEINVWVNFLIKLVSNGVWLSGVNMNGVTNHMFRQKLCRNGRVFWLRYYHYRVLVYEEKSHG